MHADLHGATSCVIKNPSGTSCWSRAVWKLESFLRGAWMALADALGGLCRRAGPSADADGGRHHGLVLQRRLGRPRGHQRLVGLPQPGEDTRAEGRGVRPRSQCPGVGNDGCGWNFSVWCRSSGVLPGSADLGVRGGVVSADRHTQDREMLRPRLSENRGSLSVSASLRGAGHRWQLLFVVYHDCWGFLGFQNCTHRRIPHYWQLHDPR